MITVEGFYTDGTIELKEQPDNIGTAHVLVTFVEIKSPLPYEERERQRKEAIERMMASMRSGIRSDNGGPYYTNRDELYEDRMEQLTRRFVKDDAEKE